MVDHPDEAGDGEPQAAATPPADDPEDPAPPETSTTGDDLGRTEATRVIARTLAEVVPVLRWPSLVLLAAPVPAMLVGIWVVARFSGWASLIGALVLLALASIGVLCAIRRRRYLDAVTDRDELARQLRAILEPSLVTDEAVDLIGRVAQGGGWFLLRRLKAVWALLRFPDHMLGELGRFDRARWFVPPTLGTSALLFTLQWWIFVTIWPVMLLLVILSLTGVIGS